MRQNPQPTRLFQRDNLKDCAHHLAVRLLTSFRSRRQHAIRPKLFGDPTNSA